MSTLKVKHTKAFIPKSVVTHDARIEKLFNTLGHKSNITNGLTETHRAVLKATSHGQNILPQSVKKIFHKEKPFSTIHAEMNMEYYKGPITDEAAFSMIGRADYVTKKDEHNNTNKFVCILKAGNSYKRIEYSVGNQTVEIYYSNSGAPRSVKVYFYTDTVTHKSYKSLDDLIAHYKTKVVSPKAANAAKPAARSKSRSKSRSRSRSRSKSSNAAKPGKVPSYTNWGN
jgi:hypothetical protein